MTPALLLAAALSAPAAAEATLPGTPWTLAEPADWTDADRAGLVRLAHRLPAALLAPPGPVVLHRGSDPAGATGEPARLRRATGRDHLHLAPDVSAPAAVVHGLVHRVERAGHHARDPRWLRLSGWTRVGPLWWTPERAPEAFAGPAGTQSPLEDLATMAAALYTAPAASGDAHPACRTPSKAAAIQAWLGPLTAAPTCASLGQVHLDPAQIDRVEVVYVAATGASAASVSGHVLLALHTVPDEDGLARHESFGMVARTDGLREGSMAYTWRGLTGGFPSQVVREPFTTTALRYSQFENRALHRFTLRLTDAEEVALLHRLDELERAWDRPYLFTSRNCTALLVELVSAFRDFDAPQPLSPDVLMALLDREGLLSPLPADRPEELALGDRARRARSARADELSALAESLPEVAPLATSLDADSAHVRAAAYERLASLSAGAADTARRAGRVLAWSDTIEQSAMLGAELRVTADHTTAVDGLRRAGALLPVAADGPTPAQQVRAAEVQPAPGAAWTSRSAHSPYRPVRVEPTVRFETDTATPWITLATPLYDGRHGAGRRFGLSPGMEVGVLVGELQLPIDRVAWMRGRLAALRVRHIDLGRPGPRVGWAAAAGELQSARQDIHWRESSWLRASGLLVLAQHDELRHHLALEAGVAGRSWRRAQAEPGVAGLWAAGQTLDQGLGLGLPVSARLQLQRRGQPLTHLRLTGGWTPIVGLDGAWRHLPSADAVAGLRLRRFGRWDGALSLGGSARSAEARPDPTGAWTLLAPEAEARVGVVFERW